MPIEILTALSEPTRFINEHGCQVVRYTMRQWSYRHGLLIYPSGRCKKSKKHNIRITSNSRCYQCAVLDEEYVIDADVVQAYEELQSRRLQALHALEIKYRRR